MSEKIYFVHYRHPKGASHQMTDYATRTKLEIHNGINKLTEAQFKMFGKKIEQMRYASIVEDIKDTSASENSVKEVVNKPESKQQQKPESNKQDSKPPEKVEVKTESKQEDKKEEDKSNQTNPQKQQ